MIIPKSTTTVIALFSILFPFCFDLMGQTSTKFDYSEHSFSESDVLQMLADSSYIGLSYIQVTSMKPKEVWAFAEKTGISLTNVLIAQSTARADRLAIEARFLDMEEKKIYDDVDRKLGIKK